MRHHFIRRWPKARREDRKRSRMLAEMRRNAITVSTEEFYRLTCKLSFFRMSLHYGAMYATCYYVEVPPEDDPEFNSYALPVETCSPPWPGWGKIMRRVLGLLD